MVIVKRLLMSSTCVLVGAAALSGCGDASSSDLRGVIHIESPVSLGPLSRTIASKFERRNPAVKIIVRQADDEQALEDLCAGKVDIAGASRPIRLMEAETCEKKGISYGEAAIANEAVVVLLHPSHPKTCIRIETLSQIWGSERPISRWSELPNIDLSFDAKIERFGPSLGSAPFDLFTAAINGAAGRQTRASTKPREDKTRLIDRVAESRGAIGYLDFGSVPEGTKAVTVAAVENEQSGICVPPNLVTVQDRSYKPLSRELLLYPSAEALDEPTASAFVNYYLEHANEVAASAGLVPLSEAQHEESRRNLMRG